MEALSVEGVASYTCNIMGAGSGGDGTVYIHLQEVHNTFSTMFNASGEGRQQILDTALSAVSDHFTVDAYLTSTEQNSEIYALFVNPSVNPSAA